MTQPVGPAAGDEHHLDPDTVGGRASALPDPGGGTVYLYAGRPGPEPRCVCGAPWLNDGCGYRQQSHDMITEALRTTRELFGAALLTALREQHRRAVDAGQTSVAAFLATLIGNPMPPPATVDGTTRSPCLPIAMGEAWVADLGTPPPAAWDSPIPDGYRYAGAVGTNPDQDPTGAEAGFPAVKLTDPDEPADITLAAGRWAHPPNRTEAEIEWHDLHLVPGLDNRAYVLVIADRLGRWRVCATRAHTTATDPRARAGQCARARSTVVLYPDQRTGERARFLVAPATVRPVL